MKRILIVGATKGIGAAIASIEHKNAHIISFSRNPMEDSSPIHEHYQLDASTDDLPEIDPVNTIIYCPGSINLKPIHSLSEDDFLNDFRQNVLGAVRVIKQYIKPLKKQENPSILLFSTVAVAQGMPFHTSVSVSKAGIEGLTKSLAAEMAPTVRVNCIAPSITNTPLASALLRNEAAIERMANRHPMKNIINPVEIANMASFLISEKAANITGQIIGIDGGLSTISL